MPNPSKYFLKNHHTSLKKVTVLVFVIFDRDVIDRDVIDKDVRQVKYIIVKGQTTLVIEKFLKIY